MADPLSYEVASYSRPARAFHWLVAALILIQLTIGFYMTYRAYEMPYVNDKGEPAKGLFDALTGQIYDSHKLIGVAILLVVIARLSYRIVHGAPPSDTSLPSWQKGASHANHWLLYLLLIVVPILGYVGTSYYGALAPFGIQLPVVTEKDEKFSEVVFQAHLWGALALIGLIALHLAAVLYHVLIRKDRVVERMLPKRNRLA